MRISKVSLSNIRGYENAELEFSPGINLIIGENNGGKTTILKSLLLIQDTSALSSSDLRIKKHEGSIEINFTGDIEGYFIPQLFSHIPYIRTERKLQYSFINNDIFVNGASLGQLNQTFRTPSFIFTNEPKNFIYPFLSKRKVVRFDQQINKSLANSVLGNFTYLFAKVDRISADGLPAKDEYLRICNEVLGFPISSYPSDSGKMAAYVVDNFQNIPLESMGEGVANILGLILDLCMAEDKLFLIEEPENDIHPKALKKLLKLIAQKSSSNQFVITTHSNIVLKYLGVAPESKIFKVNMSFEDKMPTSSVSEVPNSVEARREILEDLGYELLDFDIWDAWLILEESSAEAIIKDFLIPNFVPELKDKLKTCSSNGLEKISARVEALHSLCLFLHLQESFKERIWIIVDGGVKENRVLTELKNKYKTWSEDRFRQFKHHDFEKYYPEIFQDKVDEVLRRDKDSKRKGKRDLLEEVKNWYKENPTPAKEAFKTSACEVIEILEDIKKVILPE